MGEARESTRTQNFPTKEKSFIYQKQHAFLSYNRFFYRVEKVERSGRGDASGERGSSAVASLRFTYFMPLPLTWSSCGRNTWKRFKEYVTYSVIPCGLMVIMAVLEVVSHGCQRSWVYKTVAV